MADKKFSLVSLTNSDGCFNLQFRKDTRHERTNAPTYYRWSAQFIITHPKSEKKVLDRIKKELKCGSVTVSKNQARFSVQKIADIAEHIVPFFKKNALAEKKKRDFQLWLKAVEIIEGNKGKALASWKKNDVLSLMQIHSSCAKYKKPQNRQPKWFGIAKDYSRVS